MEPVPSEAPLLPVNKEVSPQGRYVKLDEKLGSGAYKDVWRAYDTIEGMEVAWNVVKLSRIPPAERKRIKTEVKLLRDIEHKNVIKYYSSWVNREKEQIVFITEIMSAGSLKEYLRKNPMIRWNAVKRWCKQILKGLEFLHSKQIIHRDIKCDNIFVNGSTGDIRIGDLGLSTKISENRAVQAADLSRDITSAAMTCLGTPEFMAPELYEEKYDEKVDIYAFGMTIIEMVTALTPYHECTSAPQIYKKVLRGELPPELARVKNEKAEAFIKKCLQKHDLRPDAKELLADPFLRPIEEEDFMVVRVSLIEDGNQAQDDVEDTSKEKSLELRSDSPSQSDDENKRNQELDTSEGPAYQFASSLQANKDLVQENNNTNGGYNPDLNCTNSIPVPSKYEGHIDESVTLSPDRVRHHHSDYIDLNDHEIDSQSLCSGNFNENRKGFSRVRKVKGSREFSAQFISSSKDLDPNSDLSLIESNFIPGEAPVDDSYQVKVINLRDQPNNPSSLIFTIRLQNALENAEVEFDFDLQLDNTETIVNEMQEDTTLARLKIPSENILRAINPIAQLARDVEHRKGVEYFAKRSLSSAVLTEIQILYLDAQITEYKNNRFEKFTNSLEQFTTLHESARRIDVTSIPIEIPTDLDTDELELVNDLSLAFNDKDVLFQELITKWRDVYIKSEKEHIKKINTIDQEREKLEEFSKKEHERLLARKNDLSTQLLSMEVKFKERMTELDSKKLILSKLIEPLNFEESDITK